MISFVHVSDTHINRDKLYRSRHVDFGATERAGLLIEHIKQLPFAVDFVLHTGDVMHDPLSADEYDIAKQMFSKLHVPVYFLSGNHDFATMLIEGLLDSVHPRPVQPDKLYYDFEWNGVQIVCLDSSLPAQPHGLIDPVQLAWLSAICTAEDSRPLIVAVHHHLLPIGVPWFDTMRVENGIEVHEVLRFAQHRLRAVLFGHIHQNLQLLRDGIPYFSTLSSWFQLKSWQGQSALVVDDVQVPGYNVVTLTERDTFVRGYRVNV